jgi:hypothetical protein
MKLITVITTVRLIALLVNWCSNILVPPLWHFCLISNIICEFMDLSQNIIYYLIFWIPWLIITGSGFHDWIYWHFITITINYNSSQSMTDYDWLHSLLDHEHLPFHCDEWRQTNHWAHTELCELRLSDESSLLACTAPYIGLIRINYTLSRKRAYRNVGYKQSRSSCWLRYLENVFTEALRSK